MTHDHINPDRFADSAGVPWSGRKLEANPFAGDDGTANPALIDAIKAFHVSGDPSNVFTEFSNSRILIPLVANLGESGEGAHGQTVDKSADLSIVTVQCPDGATALPVFSSVEAMARWNPGARPVPSDAVRASIAAASEGNTRIVLDANSETEYVFRRPAIAALGQQLPWQAPHLNLELQAQISAICAKEPVVVGVRFGSEDPASKLLGEEFLITLQLAPGLDGPGIQDLVTRLATSWSSIEGFTDQVDSLKVAIEPAA